MALTVLVAPSGFKECISAGVAAAAITAGVRRALPDACIAAVPMVDGGEGFTEALVEATGGVRRLCRVSDPLGRPVLATLGVIREVVRAVAEEGVSEEELAKAKTYLIGAYPINNLDSSTAVARTLLELQRDKRGIDYIERRAALIEAVTLDEVRQAAQRLLSADPAVLVIGPEAEGGNGG